MTTVHLTKVFYAIINNTFNGFQHTRQNHEALSAHLASGDDRYSFVGKDGVTYDLVRVYYFSTGKHGFRLMKPTAPYMDVVVEKTNAELETLDTEYADWINAA